MIRPHKITHFRTQYFLFAAWGLAHLFSNTAQATPINNQHDPVIFHTVMGSDKFYNPAKKVGFSSHLSPFYQHCKSANRPQGHKTSNGNMLGPWNMDGLFLNGGAARGGALRNYNNAFNAINALNAGAATPQNYLRPFTNDAMYNADDAAFIALNYKDVVSNYEKMGVRGQVNFDLGVGLGMAVKAGIANMKNYPGRFTLQDQLYADAGITPALATPAGNPDAAIIGQAQIITRSLMLTNPRTQVLKDLGFDIGEYQKTDIEDLYGSVYWHLPFKIHEKGEHVFSIVPYLSVGASLPMSSKRDPSQLFSVINGNDGFIGVSADGSIALDFPDMLQVSAGGGITMYNSRDIANVHVPTSVNQSTLYPWATSINRQPGPLWYVNVSMKAENFLSKKDVPNASCYFDYIYTEHLHDSIKIKEPNAAFAAAFIPQKLEQDSRWKTQVVHMGLKYALSRNIALGMSIQGTIGGSRTYRPTTLLGGLIVTF